VPVERGATLARRTPGRPAARGLLPRGLHLAGAISAIAYTNKELVYGLLFDLAAETLRTIAADPKHLGARIGVTLVLHTWGSALTTTRTCTASCPAVPRPRCRALGLL